MSSLSTPPLAHVAMASSGFIPWLWCWNCETSLCSRTPSPSTLWWWRVRRQTNHGVSLITKYHSILLKEIWSERPFLGSSWCFRLVDELSRNMGHWYVFIPCSPAIRERRPCGRQRWNSLKISSWKPCCLALWASIPLSMPVGTGFIPWLSLRCFKRWLYSPPWSPSVHWWAKKRCLGKAFHNYLGA